MFFRAAPESAHNGGVTAVQAKCAECEAEGNEQQAEQDGSESVEVQRTPAFESGDDGQQALLPVQRQSAFESDGQGVQMKPRGQRGFSTSQSPFIPALDGVGHRSETAKPFFTPVQPKLTVGKPGDRYELEADRMADRIVQSLAQKDISPPLASPPSAPALQAKSDAGVQEEDLQRREEDDGEQLDLQRRVFAQTSGDPGDEAESRAPVVFAKGLGQRLATGADLSGQLTSNKGRGAPMPAETRGEMESAFQADFSGVRIHTDTESVQMSRRLRAQAFTHGNDIYFNQGKFNPASREGKHLVAHELTHTLQQGASLSRQVSRKTQQTDAAGQETPAVQTNLLDDALSLGGRVVSGVAQGVRRVGGAIVDAAGNVISAGQRGLSAVGAGASNLVSRGANFVAGIVDRFAPGLTALLNGGLVEGIKQRIVGGVRSVVGGVLERVRSGELSAQLRETLLAVRTRVMTTAAQMAGGDCSALFQVFHALRDFAGLLFSPVLNRARGLLDQGGAFVLNLWNQFGAPAFQAIQAFAGSAWQWIQAKASWIWESTAPIRSGFAEVWAWIKTQLGIARDSAAGVLETLRQAAVDVWDSIKGELTPFLGPLSTVGTALVLMSPLGPVMMLYKGAPALWSALRWVWDNLTSWRAFLDAKEMIVNEIIPALRSGFSWLSGALSAAKQWMGEQFAALSAAFNDVLNALRASPLFQSISGIFATIKQQFDILVGAIRVALSPILTTIGTMISIVWRCLRPVVEFLVGLLALLNNRWMWPFYAIGLANRMAWALLPEGFKRVAIGVLLDFSIRVTRSMDREMVQAPNIGSLWPVVVAGMVSFLERLRERGPDAIMQAIEKLLNLAINPRTYGGFFLGILKGFLWNGIVGLVRLVFDLIAGIPQALIGLYQFVRNLIPDAQMVYQLMARGRAIAEQVQAFIQRPDAVQQFIEFIRQSPSILFSMVNTAMNEARGWAQRTGVEIANTLLLSIGEANPFNVGFKVGTVVGILLFELVLLLGTGGGGTALKWGGKAVQWLLKGVRWIGRGLARGGSLIRQALGMLRRVVDAGWAAARRVGGALRGVLESLRRYLDDVIAWIRRALQHLGRRAGNFARNQALWQEFRFAVGLAMRPVNRGFEGLTRSQARTRFRPILTRFHRVASAPLGRLVVAGEDRGYWTLRARRRRGLTMLLTRDVGEVLMQRRHRWDLGRDAVRRRLMRRVRDRDLSTRGLQRIIDPLKDPYRFQRLEVVRDEPENDWNIMGAMSPVASVARVGPASTPRVRQATGGQMLQQTNTSGQLAEVDDVEGLHTGSRGDPIPIHWYKGLNAYPSYITLIINDEPDRFNMFGNRDVYWNGERFRVGVSARNHMYRGRKVQKLRRHARIPSAQRSFRELLKAKGYRRFFPRSDPRTKDVDHVRDLGWGGSNANSNLWPLLADINQRPTPYRGGFDWAFDYIIEYKKWENHGWKWKSAPLYGIELAGKWFKIIGYNYPPRPNPGGKD